MLTLLEAQPENEALPLQTLTQKLLLLMALTIANRCSDLTALDLSFRAFQEGGVVFSIPGLTRLGEMGHLHKNSTQSFAALSSQLLSAMKGGLRNSDARG